MAETEKARSQAQEQLLPELSKLSLEPSLGQTSNVPETNGVPKLETKSASAALQSYQTAAAGGKPSKPSKQQATGNSKTQLAKDAVEDESSEISASDDGSWIAWFCSLRGNEFFCEVDEDYIQDDFNLTGLHLLVPYYDYALDMVLDVEMPMEEKLTEAQQEIVESAAVRCIWFNGFYRNAILFIPGFVLTRSFIRVLGNALWAHSRTVHFNKPRHACHV